MIVIEIIIGGVVGTICMTVVMTFIHRAGWANGDMIRALGSLVTKSYHNAIAPGLAIHFAVGIAVAVPYTFILRAIPTQVTLAYIAIGAVVGIFHGAAMSFILLAAIADNHPVEQFREPSFDVAAAHVAGHIAYGMGVGAMVAAFGV